MPERSRRSKGKQTPEQRGFKFKEKYVYKDESGKRKYEVLRWEHPDPDVVKIFTQGKIKDGRRIPSMTGVQLVPYQLDKLVSAPMASTLYVVEGEKDVHTLLELGKLATTNSGGSGSSKSKTWQASWRKWFTRFDRAIVIADADAAGREHARRVYACLEPVMGVKIFECTQGKDVSEHLAKGGQLKGLKNVTVAVLATNSQAPNGVQNGHSRVSVGPVGWTAVRCAQRALERLFEDVPEGARHNGRADTAWWFAQQLRDVPRDVSEEAMRIYVENCPQYDSEGESKAYPIESAMERLDSALSDVPDDWEPGVFSRPYSDDFTRMLETQRMRREVIKVLNNEEAERQFKEAPSLPTLRDELLIEEELKYTILGLHVTGGNTVLQAKKKVGKTTLLANLMKSLVDGKDFLGSLPVWSDGAVGFWNYEVSPRQFRIWLREIGIRNQDRAAMWNLRGYRLPLTVERVEDMAVEWLGSRNIKTLIIDPFSRAYGGDENSNSEQNEWCETLDVIKERSGVQDVFIAHHIGNAEFEEGEERGRGASRLEGWVDHKWVLSKDKEGTRFLWAEGRDVDFAEQSLDFNKKSRRMYLSGGSRGEVRALRQLDEDVSEVVAIVSGNPGIGTSQLRASLSGRNTRRDAAVEEAGRRNLIRIEREGQAVRHYPW